MQVKDRNLRKMRMLMVNRRVHVCVMLIMTAILTYNVTRPTIEPGNINLNNPYGAEGLQRLPHAIIIGVRKGGTGALLTYLKLHPHIRMAASEGKFFSYWFNYRQGLEWYRHLMPYSLPDQITMEKTPGYFSRPDAVQQIHQMNSSIKLILLVRDPVKRAVSDYLQDQENHWFFRAPLGFNTFEKVANPNGLLSGYLWCSTYIEILQEWLKHFPKEQILILDGDMLITDPLKQMQKVETFLGVKHFLDESNFVYNLEKRFYCTKDISKPRMQCLGKTKGRPHPEIDLEVKRELWDYFRPYNERLFEFMGERFDWEGM